MYNIYMWNAIYYLAFLSEYFLYAYLCSAFNIFNVLVLFNEIWYNKYFLPLSNMSFIYTGFTVSLMPSNNKKILKNQIKEK